jgi:hypothetical protein
MPCVQGDLIGRIFVCWAIVNCEKFFENYRTSPNFGAPFSLLKLFVNIIKKWAGLQFGLNFFTNASGHHVFALETATGSTRADPETMMICGEHSPLCSRSLSLLDLYVEVNQESIFILGRNFRCLFECNIFPKLYISILPNFLYGTVPLQKRSTVS